MKFKKIGICLSICLSIILSLPSIPVHAYEGFKVGTYDTLNSLVSDTENTQNLYNIDNTFFSSWTQEDYEAYFALDNMPFNPFTNDSLWVLGTGNSVGNVTIWCMDLTSVGVPDWSCYTVSSGNQIAGFYNSQPAVSSVPIYIYIYYPASNNWVKYSQGTVSLTTAPIKAFVVNPDTGLKEPDSSSSLSTTYSFQWSSGVTTPFLWGNIDHVYSFKYWNYHESTNFSNINTAGIPNNFPAFMYANSGDTGIGYFDFFNHGNILYWNGDEYVDAGGTEDIGETNENHLYLTNFDIGFCKPYHNEDLYRAGGGYVYLKYNFDSWVNSHISDYNLQIITELNVNGNITSYPTVRNLDAQGISVFSFKEMASSFN